MLALALNAVVLGALLILAAAAASALREGIGQKARVRGLVLVAAVLVASLMLLWVVLV